jgi:putative ABC transport system permease protein
VNWVGIVNNTSLAVQTIRAHKMRAFLTVLGVVMGTGTIIGVGAILTGFDSQMTALFNSFGPNSMIVYKWRAGAGGANPSPEERTRKDLTYSNVQDIRAKCTACASVSPNTIVRNGLLEARYKGNDMYGVNISGAEEEYADSGQADMSAGRFITDQDNRRAANVVALGADLVKSLYSNVDPIGKPITVDGHQYTVIGTMNKPAASFFGQDDLRVLMPYFAFRKNYPAYKDMYLVVTAKQGHPTRTDAPIADGHLLYFSRHFKLLWIVDVRDA